MATKVIQIQVEEDSALRFIVGSDGHIRVQCRPSGCWEWLGAVAPNGYGRIGWYDHRVYQAHRVAYAIFRGEIPMGDLDHLCRNRKCVNPWHLEPVTRAINARRGARSKLSQAQVDEIRARWGRREVSQTQMGREYGVHSSVICEIVNGKIWRQ